MSSQQKEENAKIEKKSWEKNYRKRLYNEGRLWFYKKQQRDRKFDGMGGLKCKFKCTNKFKTEYRYSIHKSFWVLSSDIHRKDYYYVTY